jgi:radical SAM superfamily enzyme YgiQ (UPF0313 family)
MPTWPLGMACIASATRAAGHEVFLLDLMHADDWLAALDEAIIQARPEVIGMSMRNIDDQNMKHPVFFLDQVREIVRAVRNLSEAPIVLGGAGYSIYPESSLEFVGADMGIQGEGESIFTALLERLAGKADLAGLPGLYLANQGLQGERAFVENLDDSPLPGPEVLFPRSYDSPDFWLPVQTRRGCPMNCSYCSTSTIEGTRFRSRSPNRVVAWLAQWVESGINRFYFVDNTFNHPASYARTLCQELAQRSLPLEWRCILYPDKVDRDLVKSMARSGCSEVALGFESGSEQVLHRLNKRFKPDEVRRTSGILTDHGIRQMGFLVLGGPGETKETVEQSLSFADSLELDAMKITVGLRIYPYTDLATIAVDEGVVTADDDLLLPRFYLVSGLDDWLYTTAKDWAKARPNWIF